MTGGLTKAESFSCGPEMTTQQQQQQQQHLTDNANGNMRQQLIDTNSATGFHAGLVQVEKQQHLVSSSTNVELLARKSQHLTIGHRKQIGVSLSNDPTSSELATASSPDFLNSENDPQSMANLPPSSARIQHQQSTSSFKKSNFFQGFRSTLRGRRGSKQAIARQQHQLQQQQQQTESQVELAQQASCTDSTTAMQQSVSLSSINNQSIGRLANLGTSKKIKHKLLHGLIEPTSTASGSSSSTSDTPLSSGQSAPFFNPG